MPKLCFGLLIVLAAICFPIYAENTAQPGTGYYIRYFFYNNNVKTTEVKLFAQGRLKLRLENRTISSKGIVSSEPASISIFRADMMVAWEYNPKEKKCVESKLAENDIPRILGEDPATVARKIGAEKILGYDCDVFEFEGGQVKNWIIKNSPIMLKSIDKDNTFKSEAVEIKFTIQDDSLFENSWQ
jgi:hypothetical protein